MSQAQEITDGCNHNNMLKIGYNQFACSDCAMVCTVGNKWVDKEIQEMLSTIHELREAFLEKIGRDAKINGDILQLERCQEALEKSAKYAKTIDKELGE